MPIASSTPNGEDSDEFNIFRYSSDYIYISITFYLIYMMEVMEDIINFLI